MSSSGGGSSGSVSFPTYIEDWHGELLTGQAAANDIYDIESILDGILGNSLTTANTNNPYINAIEYPIESDISAITDRFNEALSAVNAGIITTGQNEYEAMLDSAANKFDELVGTDYIDNLTDAYKQDTERTHYASMNALMAQMSDINAVQSSAYVIGLSLLEHDRAQDINNFRGRLIAEATGRKAQFISIGVNHILATTQIKWNFEQIMTNINTDIKYKNIIAQKDYYARELELDVHSKLWPLEVMRYGVQMGQAPSGGSFVPDKPSRGQSALSGALGGAAAGAMISPEAPLIGAAVGALAGGVLGWNR